MLCFVSSVNGRNYKMNDTNKIIQTVRDMCKKKTVIKPRKQVSAPHPDYNDFWAPKPFESKWERDIFNDSEQSIKDFLNEVKKI